MGQFAQKTKANHRAIRATLAGKGVHGDLWPRRGVRDAEYAECLDIEDRFGDTAQYE